MTTKPQNSKGSNETLADWVASRADELTEQYALKAAGFEPRTHVPTGLRRLDAAGLLEPGIATVVLGHEGDGKSALGLAFCEGAARAGLSVDLHTPEDPRKMVADRILAGQVGESAAKLRRLRIDGAGLRLASAVRESLDWTSRIRPYDGRLTAGQICELIDKNRPGLVVVDYAQVLAGADESDAERVLAKAVWDFNEAAKNTGASVVLLSQVRTQVKERGRRLFDSWRARNPGPITPEAVEGYRPLPGDGQWAPNALGQKPRAVLSWFRPGLWARQHGSGVADDTAELRIIKSNYGPGAETLKLRWHGPTTTITDPKE